MFIALALTLSTLAAPDTCIRTVQHVAHTKDGAAIAFELTYRGSEVRRPTAILISGAGPQHRRYSTDAGNGESGNRAFETLRQALVGAGYAVILFDERGTGLSTGDYSRTATTASLSSDVEAIIDRARHERAVDPDRILLLGHSEGGAIALLVASRSPAVSHVVLLGAPAWTGARIIEWQHEHELANGEWSYRYPTRESRVQYLQREHERRIAEDPWYRYFLTSDPLEPIERVTVPILVLHGALDNKVAAAQASEIAEAARRSGNRHVSLRVLPQHDHSFNQPGPQQQNAQLSGVVLRTITKWVSANAPTSSEGLRCR